MFYFFLQLYLHFSVYRVTMKAKEHMFYPYNMPIKPTFATLRFCLSFGVAAVPILTRLIAWSHVQGNVHAFSAQDFLFFSLTMLICSANEILDDSTAKRQIHSIYLAILMLATLFCGMLLGFSYLPLIWINQTNLFFWSLALDGVSPYISFLAFVKLKRNG